MYSIFALTREGAITLDFEDKTVAIETYWQVKKAVGLNVEFYTGKDDKTLKPKLDDDTFVWKELPKDKWSYYVHKAWFKLILARLYADNWRVLIAKGQHSGIWLIDFVGTKTDAVSKVSTEFHYIADKNNLDRMLCYSESTK